MRVYTNRNILVENSTVFALFCLFFVKVVEILFNVLNKSNVRKHFAQGVYKHLAKPSKMRKKRTILQNLF